MTRNRKTVSPGNSPEDFDSFPHFTLPVRISSAFFGFSPFIYEENRFRFHLVPFTYCVVVVLSTSLARIYLTPRESRSSFFYQVLYYKQILMPATCILSFFVVVIKMKKFMKYFEEIMIFRKYLNHGQKKRLFFVQIFLIFLAFISFSLINILIYLVAPPSYKLIPSLLDIHLSMTLWVIKLQFYVGMVFLWYVLGHIRRSILKLSKADSALVFDPPTVDLFATEILFEKVITLSETLNDCYEIALGVASILTALNCITTAYFHVMTVDEESGPFLLVWLGIDFAQEWLVLSGAELFMNEVRKIPIAVHDSMRRIQNQVLIKQLKHFSLYLLHRQVRFNICGMVPLDYTLLFTIAGAVTTYMIVLVQFQKTENSSCLRNNTLTN